MPGPAAAVTANAVARWSGTGGNDIKGSAATVNDSGDVSTPGLLTAKSALASPAAASAVAALVFGAAALGLYWGTGTPNAVLTAAKGSLYIRTDGSSSSTRLYQNTDGATAWTNITAAA